MTQLSKCMPAARNFLGRMRPIRNTGTHCGWPLALALTVVVAFAGLSPAPASAKVMQAPGSRVSLDLPKGFNPSSLFAGFMEIISSAAVIMLELPPEAYPKVVAGLNAKALATKGITNLKVSTLQRTDKHYFLTGEQKHPRAVFRKYILVLNDAKGTAVITFNVPKGSFTNGSLSETDVIKAMTSAKLEAKAAPSKDLFTVGYIGPYKQVGAPTGTSRIYADKTDTGPKEMRNILAIAPSLNRLPIKSIKQFSQYALQSLKNHKDLKATNTRDVRIDNMSGHQITATAKRGASETPVVIRQLILLPASGGYFRLLAVNKATDDARLGPELDKIFASFKATATTNKVE